MLERITRFLRDECGLETVEIAIVGGLVVTVGALAFTQIGDDSRTLLAALADALSAAASDPGGGGGGRPGCGIGPELALAVPLLTSLHRRRRRRRSRRSRRSAA
jgi:Flp pilus assembly pilin Flp